MAIQYIQQSLEKVARFFAENPQAGRVQDKPAMTVLESGLRCRAEGPNGTAVVSDLPEAVGGAGSAPSPGWLLRAALANCDATMIALRSAQLGIVLTRLEVTVGSESDDRGMFGLSDSAHPGPLSMTVTVRIAAEGTPQAQLAEVVRWAMKHSPVGDALHRIIPVATIINND